MTAVQIATTEHGDLLAAVPITGGYRVVGWAVHHADGWHIARCPSTGVRVLDVPREMARRELAGMVRAEEAV